MGKVVEKMNEEEVKKLLVRLAGRGVVTTVDILECLGGERERKKREKRK